MFESTVLSDDVVSKLTIQWARKDEFKVIIRSISELSAEVDRLSKELSAHRAATQDVMKSG